MKTVTFTVLRNVGFHSYDGSMLKLAEIEFTFGLARLREAKGAFGHGKVQSVTFGGTDDAIRGATQAWNDYGTQMTTVGGSGSGPIMMIF